MLRATSLPLALAPLLLAASAAAEPASTVGRVALRAEDVGPLPVGERVPPVILRDVMGRPVPLDRVLGQRYTALIFYRGGW